MAELNSIYKKLHEISDPVEKSRFVRTHIELQYKANLDRIKDQFLKVFEEQIQPDSVFDTDAAAEIKREISLALEVVVDTCINAKRCFDLSMDQLQSFLR